MPQYQEPRVRASGDVQWQILGTGKCSNTADKKHMAVEKGKIWQWLGGGYWRV